MEEYLKALTLHLEESAPQAQSYRVDSIYFGGGTPSYFGGERLAQVLRVLQKNYHIDRDCEITVECNPDSVDEALLTTLKKAGVNRLSMGVQSACEQELQKIGRLHSFAQACRAVELARTAGFDNLSLDLIYGLPDQTMESWKATVEEVLRLECEHLSCYGLKLEQNTPLYQRREQETMVDDDTQADMYLWMVERLKQAGYAQYEISNFARPGRQSRHNLKYWMGEEYMGFGPSAHSYIGGCRYGFVRDLDYYVKGVLYNGRLIDQSEQVNRRERGKEYLMLRMRTVYGVNGEEYRQRYYLNFQPLEERFREYQSYGWAQCDQGRWHFTPTGFLLSNPLIGDLLAIQDETARNTMRPILSRRIEHQKKKDESDAKQ
jgi:oxygen-independent coproporphyrinogen-3 oxidase